jgi:hypothetical protein
MADMRKSNGLDKQREWALKSGYPFENDVFELINRVGGATTDREWQFLAKDEEGNRVHRSLDFRVTYSWNTCNIWHFSWPRGEYEKMRLQFLIEAKSTDSERFLFVPAEPNDVAFNGVGFPALVPGWLQGSQSLIRGHEELLNELRDLGSWPKALAGRKVDDQKKERDSVSPALIQLVQGTLATIEMKEKKLGTVLDAVSPSPSRDISVFVPIVVTNAPLLVLKQGLSTKAIGAARDEKDIFTKVDKLLVAQPNILGIKHEVQLILNKIRVPRTDKGLGWYEPNLTRFPLVFCTLEGLEDVIREFKGRMESYIKDHHMHMPQWIFG